MSLIRICDYNGYEIAVNDETLLFACAALNVEKPSITALKTAMREVIKERGLFKPFYVVCQYSMAGSKKRIVSKDSRGYRIENGNYITHREFKNTAIVPDDYPECVSDKIAAFRESVQIAKEANAKMNALEQAITAGFPTIEEYEK